MSVSRCRDGEFGAPAMESSGDGALRWRAAMESCGGELHEERHGNRNFKKQSPTPAQQP